MELDSLFDSPSALIDHARDHIKDAEDRCRAFFEATPYTKVIDVDFEKREEIHKLRLSAKLPAKISAVVKDATGNLRDALDHAVFASAVAISGNVNPSDTGFPFAKDANGVTGELHGKRLRGNPPEIRPFLASLNPHETGNALLWSLNKIRNPNTHRVIIPVGAATIAGDASMNGFHIIGGLRFGYSRWHPTTNEVEFLRVGIGSIVNYQVDITSHVAFGDIETLRGKEIIGTLLAMATEVERIVSGIKAETARILRERAP
ncbi:hypothetical protein NKG60_27960 [Mesorhizobium sp. M1428]|uniref:hypothetical protein n=1 Tax=Mesorhizobium sp. M1428 TaxID=2957102 RepID=UPI003334D941